MPKYKSLNSLKAQQLVLFTEMEYLSYLLFSGFSLNARNHLKSTEAVLVMILAYYYNHKLLHAIKNGRKWPHRYICSDFASTSIKTTENQAMTLEAMYLFNSLESFLYKSFLQLITFHLKFRKESVFFPSSAHLNWASPFFVTEPFACPPAHLIKTVRTWRRS